MVLSIPLIVGPLGRRSLHCCNLRRSSRWHQILTVSLKANGAKLLFVSVLIPATIFAQQGDRSANRISKTLSENQAQSFLLSSTQGLSVVGTALKAQEEGLYKLDCSHLVNTIYERAGFSYSYASSSELFAGVKEFRAVTRPHSGDLVVWPGHVGIVVSPSKTTFFSALRSGVGVESYSSSYWKDRGTPRFYRYAKVAEPKGGDNTSATPNLTRTGLDSAANNDWKYSAEANLRDDKTPGLLIINSAKLQTSDVSNTLFQSFGIDPQGLREGDVFELTRPLIVFSQVEVRALRIRGHHGNVDVRITALLSLESGKVNLKQWQQVQTWAIRKQDRKRWDLQLPQDAIYMTKETAVRVLAHQLSLLADAGNQTASRRQKSQLAQMLNTILSD
jgi:hypothetical protein